MNQNKPEEIRRLEEARASLHEAKDRIRAEAEQAARRAMEAAQSRLLAAESRLKREHAAMLALLKRAVVEKRCDHAADPCSWCEPARALIAEVEKP